MSAHPRYRLIHGRSTNGQFTLTGLDLRALDETADVWICWDIETGGQFLAVTVPMYRISEDQGSPIPWALSKPFPREQSAIDALYTTGFEPAEGEFTAEVIKAAIAQGFAEKCG